MPTRYVRRRRLSAGWLLSRRPGREEGAEYLRQLRPSPGFFDERSIADAVSAPRDRLRIAGGIDHVQFRAKLLRQKLIGIRAQIAGGAEFATVARAVSEDPQSATDGGDLGWITATTPLSSIP